MINGMDELYKPAPFNASPDSPTAAKEWMYWKNNFEFFMNNVPPPTIGCNDGSHRPQAVNKLLALTNCVAFSVFEHIADCKTYSEAIARLDRIYLKPPISANPVFARHVLLNSKQHDGQSIAEFASHLSKIGKNCNFQSVTAEAHRKGLLLDAFIQGLQSNTIRQRLLEKQNLDIYEALAEAKAVEAELHLSRPSDDLHIHPQYATSNIRKLAYKRLWQEFEASKNDNGSTINGTIPDEKVMDAIGEEKQSSLLCSECSWHNDKICPLCNK